MVNPEIFVVFCADFPLLLDKEIPVPVVLTSLVFLIASQIVKLSLQETELSSVVFLNESGKMLVSLFFG